MLKKGWKSDAAAIEAFQAALREDLETVRALFEKEGRLIKTFWPDDGLRQAIEKGLMDLASPSFRPITEAKIEYLYSDSDFTKFAPKASVTRAKFAAYAKACGDINFSDLRMKPLTKAEAIQNLERLAREIELERYEQIAEPEYFLKALKNIEGRFNDSDFGGAWRTGLALEWFIKQEYAKLTHNRSEISRSKWPAVHCRLMASIAIHVGSWPGAIQYATKLERLAKQTGVAIFLVLSNVINGWLTHANGAGPGDFCYGLEAARLFFEAWTPGEDAITPEFTHLSGEILLLAVMDLANIKCVGILDRGEYGGIKFKPTLLLLTRWRDMRTAFVACRIAAQSYREAGMLKRFFYYNTRAHFFACLLPDNDQSRISAFNGVGMRGIALDEMAQRLTSGAADSFARAGMARMANFIMEFNRNEARSDHEKALDDLDAELLFWCRVIRLFPGLCETPLGALVSETSSIAINREKLRRDLEQKVAQYGICGKPSYFDRIARRDVRFVDAPA